jgi:LPXTG-motif cell wall-anchored protein
VLGEEESNNGQTTGLQPERQEENGSGGQLPFTGFAAIPVLLGGIALLSGGLLLRRRAREE